MTSPPSRRAVRDVLVEAATELDDLARALDLADVVDGGRYFDLIDRLHSTGQAVIRYGTEDTQVTSNSMADPHLTCPNCGASIRARMADTQEKP